jgi:hypothetical protein
MKKFHDALAVRARSALSASDAPQCGLVRAVLLSRAELAGRVRTAAAGQRRRVPPCVIRELSPPPFAQNYDDFVPKLLTPLFDHVLAFQRYVLSHPAAAGFSKPRLEVFSSTLSGRSSSRMAVGPRTLILLRRPQERGNVPDRAHIVHKRA